MKYLLYSLGLLFLSACSVAAQSASEPKQTATKDQAATQNDRQSSENTKTVSDEKSESPIVIHLVSGGRLEVEEVRETKDGFWYKRSGMETLLDRSRVDRIERPSSEPAKTEVAQEASGWTIADSVKVERFFFNKFGRHLPTTALGQSDLHMRWGLDHRQGMDIGVHPDSPEGQALTEFLRLERIPFMTFRGPIPGVATGPHIHVGYPSHRIPQR